MDMSEQMDQGMDVDMSVSSEATKKKLIRCSFWPMCDKGEQCPYLHPNKPCTMFPSCQFGQLCHFLHPSCRFDGFCTRSDCAYTHVIKKPGPATALSVSGGSKEASALNVQIKPDGAATNAITESTPTKLAKPFANITPKITINKLQPFYSLVNNTSNKNTAPSASNAAVTVANTATTVTNIANTVNASTISSGSSASASGGQSVSGESSFFSAQTKLFNNHAQSSSLNYMRPTPSSMNFYSFLSFFFVVLRS